MRNMTTTITGDTNSDHAPRLSHSKPRPAKNETAAPTAPIKTRFRMALPFKNTPGRSLKEVKAKRKELRS
jgi:hypothetical protein